ncbi:MAG: hypothetical protein FWB88_07940 [Defluviitaleaceae bacterium]|nr:hypothetical protein [Defluviitaleaceae bacterium]MCL2240459.1 hypothetical protein [Defluviitaleaceae bacterium]
MASVSGRVLYDATRTAAPPGTMTGIAQVPVVLQNVATGVQLGVLTDADGNFSFLNVPPGDYRIVEAYHHDGVPSPGDFATAVPGAVPRGLVPPISYVANPPAGATDLDCTLPNTLFISVTDAGVGNLYICNGPVRYIPIESITDPCAVIDPHNILVDADMGTMGTFPPGTATDTGAPTEPYPDNVPDYTYVLPLYHNGHAPEANEYTVQNIMQNDTSNTMTPPQWWRIADHTYGNETGRMMVVNGDRPGSVFFTETIAVQSDTHYLFSVWILNMMRDPIRVEPQLGVQILDEGGQVIFSRTLGAEIPVNTAMPEWRQIGTTIYTAEHTEITVQFVSEGLEGWGNDYAIDDIALQEVRIPIFAPRKESSHIRLAVGETAQFSVTLANTCSSPLMNVTFTDPLPDGLAFVPDTVTINGEAAPGLNPETGFPVPDIPGHSTVAITFQVMAESLPETNPAINRATMSYDYTPVRDGIPQTFDVDSNPVAVRINPPSCDLHFAALQRERAMTDDVSGITAFDVPLFSKGAISYQAGGSIDIELQGTYIAFWFVSGMSGFATDGQLYKMKRYDYETSQWAQVVGASNHVKNDNTMGFAVIDVSADEIRQYGKATLALFNCADADAKLTYFTPKAGIMIYGANFRCINNRMITIDNSLLDISTHLREIERFLYLSDVTEMWSDTPELSGLGVAAIYIGYTYNFWGIGTLTNAQNLNGGEVYYLARSEQYAPLSYYQGDPTIGTLWIEAPDGGTLKFPLHFDSTGIYVLPGDDLSLAAGTKLSFTQSLILVSPSS